MTQEAKAGTAPHLKRVLGRRDLVLLFVVAITNLNIVPAVASSGPVVIWLWLLALLFFFWPQGVAVIELSQRYPGEGGVYLWTKKMFGDFHGFLSGWCYWTNNIFYVPTVLLYLVGIAVYVAGPGAARLADDRSFTFLASLGLLWLLVAANVRGLGVGKWVNNLGGVGTALAAVVLIGLGIYSITQRGSSLTAASFSVVGANWKLISGFGTICFALVGLELASIMGDEIEEPRKILPGAVLWGGIISGVLYVGATLAVLLAVRPEEIGVVQGILQAISKMAGDFGLAWSVPPIALVLSISIAGIASAWLAGAARIPFVAGLDNYLPSALGRVHPRFGSPHIALIVTAALSSLFLAISFTQASVSEAFVTLLALAVVLQLVPLAYMYAALLRLAFFDPQHQHVFYTRPTLAFAGAAGLITTILGIAVAFLPPAQVESVWRYELKMVVGCGVVLVAAPLVCRFLANRRTTSDLVPAGAKSGAPGGNS
ncbi:MAG: APC family permease [Acidobacteria bacterium]|nr:APC family permease [Acidobacteriota bacterium]